MTVIGITGNIGSGKSAVCQILANLGTVIIDADELAHEACQPHSQIWQEIVTAFGKHILKSSNEIDRKKLAQIVFSNPASLARLNKIVHPETYRLVRQKIDSYRRQGAKTIALEAALLIEAGWMNLVDKLWLVKAPDDMVLQRLSQHKGSDRTEISARLKSQTPPEEKIKYADEIIYNNSDLNQLETKVTELWHKLDTA